MGESGATTERLGLEVWLHAITIMLLMVLGLVTAVGAPVQLQAALLTAGAIVVAAMLRVAALRTVEPRLRAGWNWFTLMIVFLGSHYLVIALTGERMVTSFNEFDDISRYFKTAAYISCVVALWYCVSVPKQLLARLFLDTGIVLAGVTALVGLALPHTSLHVSGIYLTHPALYIWLVDLAALSVAVFALATVPRGAPLFAPLVNLCIALAILCFGHAGAAIASLRLADAKPGWVYLCFGLAGWMMGLMAYRYIHGTRDGAVYQTFVLTRPNPITHNLWFHLGQALVPYSIGIGAAVWLFVRALDANADGIHRQVAFVGAVAFVAVVGLRHVINYREYRELYVNLTEMNLDLERMVEQRTTELTRRNRELEAVHQVALVSAASLDLDRILQAVAEQLTLAVDATRCVIFEQASDDTSLTPVASFQRYGNTLATLAAYPVGSLDDLSVSLFEPAGRQTSLIERRWLDADSSAARLLDFHEAETAMLVPLVAGEQTIGAAELYRTHAEPFNEHEVSVAEAIATQGALAAENAHAYGMARFAANHDPVTGLLNHRALHDELTRLFNRAVLRSSRLTVLMMDLNLFKEFNDRYGHQAGDRVLADIGQVIKQSMPTTAVVARYGGDEFTVGIPGATLETTEIFVAAIRERVGTVEERHGLVGEGFGVAIGVAAYPEDGANLAEIMSKADQAMYEDKWRLKGGVDRRRQSFPQMVAGATDR